MRGTYSKACLLARDVRGLIDPVDAIALIGQRLYRGSLRRAIRLIPIIYGSWYLADKITPFPISQGLARTLAIFVLLLPIIGLIMRKIADRISRGLIMEAEASGVNLTEDVKKGHSKEHLEALWTRIFAPEARLISGDSASSDSEKEHEEINRALRSHLESLPDEIFSYLRGSKATDRKEDMLSLMVDHLNAMRPIKNGELETCQTQFMCSALYALATPIPQSEQEAIVGFPLALYEDWLDGALMHETDMKLYEQFQGHPDLKYARNHIKLRLLEKISQSIEGTSARRWFQFACRSITREIGKKVHRLNDQFETNAFDASAIVWPTLGVEDALIRQVPPEAILAWRQELIHFVTKMLRDPDEDAERLIRRMHLYSFRAATELRVRFDPEYAAGKLGYNVASDCKALRFTGTWVEKQTRMARELVEEGDRIWMELRENNQLLNMAPLDQRALRIAIHTGTWGIQEAMKGKKASKSQLQAAIQQVRKESPRINRSLLNLRIHHQLTIFQIQEYRRHVNFLVERALGHTTSNQTHTASEMETLEA